MSDKNLALLSCAVILCLFAFGNDVHGKAGQRRNNSLPRVGTIKDYPATGLMVGCGNSYFYHAAQAKPAGDAYVFLASGDGSNAWMNLDGRDLRLRQIKPSRAKNQNVHRDYYRLGRLRITVVFEKFRPESDVAAEDDPMLKMRIILRLGRAVRIVRAVGGSDC